MTSGALPLAPRIRPQPRLAERMRDHGTDKLVLGFGLLWMIYVVTQFRMPWHELTYTEDTPDSGMRQFFFPLGAAIALRRMLYTGTTHRILGMHLGGLLLGLLMVASSLWSTDALLSIKRALIYVFGYLLLVALVHTPRWPMRYFMATTVYGMGWIAWLSIGAHFVFPENCTTLAIRPGLAGLTVHPNVFGPCLGMAWGLGLGLPVWTRAQQLHRRFLMLGLLIALGMSNSITAIIATTVASALFVVLTIDGYRARAVVLAALATCILVPIVGIDQIQTFCFEVLGRDASMSGRDHLWSSVLEAGLQSPLFGNGYGAFWIEGRGRELVGTWNPRQAHNSYLDVFVDLGVLGLLVVVVIVHYKLLTSWQRLAGKRGTRQRRAVAAFVSMAAGVLLLGALGESFLLKLDKFQFFCLLWGVLVLENVDSNHVATEFAALDCQPASVATTTAR
jgi:hypothetical protein